MNRSAIPSLVNCLLLLLLAGRGTVVQSFSVIGRNAAAKPFSSTQLYSTTAASNDAATSVSATNNDKELLKRDRYVATNRKYLHILTDSIVFVLYFRGNLISTYSLITKS